MTHIQTKVSEEEYEQLRELAVQQDLSIREALREATKLWIKEQETVEDDDPVFTSVDAIRAQSTDSHRTTLTEETDLIDEWEGDADKVTLGDPEE